MLKEKERSVYLDVVKGMAIILVVLGHSIQYGTADSINGQYYDDPLFIFIYSFHMPLFMLVSGYLFYGSVMRHTFKHNIKNRFSGLVVPFIVWNTLYLFFDRYINPSYDKLSLGGVVSSYLGSFWFLWTIFFCSLVVLFVRRYLNDSVLMYGLLIAVSLFLPKTFNLEKHVFMFPYFLTGYRWNKYQMSKTLSSINKKEEYTLAIGATIVFILLYLNFHKEDFIYTSGTCILNKEATGLINFHQLRVDIYRWTIGFAGSAMSLLLFSYFSLKVSGKLKKCVCNLGRFSLGIYVISMPFLSLWVLDRMPYRENLGYGAAFLESILVLIVTYLLTYTLNKNAVTRKLFLGGR